MSMSARDALPSGAAAPPALSNRACVQCRSKKTKCDMARPRCGLCARVGSSCEFPTKRKRPSAPNPESKQRTRAMLDEHHLTLLARFLEEEPGLLETASNSQRQSHSPSQPKPIPAPTLAPELQSPQNHSTPTAHALLLGEQDFSFIGDFDTHHIFASPLARPVTTTQHSHSTGRKAEECSLGSSSQQTEEGRVVSFDLAFHLVEVYFENIAPWLPVLHQPRFLEHCARILTPGPDALGNALPEDIFTLLGIFALAARYSSQDYHWTVPPQERGHIYAQEAREVYKRNGPPLEPSLPYLQGSIILASYFYTSGLSLQGSILVGICFSLAVELDLPRLDDEDAVSDFSLSVSDKEERRRAWWAIWELDSFRSMMLMRLYAIDRRHIRVRLPISDQDWYNGTSVDSEVINFHKGIDWESLRSSPNQSPRAWYLVANNILSKVYDQLLLNETSTKYECLQNEIGCMKLSFPATFHLRATYLDIENGTTTNNWIIGTHLVLAVASYLINILKSTRDQTDVSHPDPNHSLPETIRAFETSAALRMWPPNCLPTAHPFLASALSPIFSTPFTDTVDSTTYQSLASLCNLVLQKFADNWELGRLILAIHQMLLSSDHNPLEYQYLAKRFPTLLRPLVRKTDKARHSRTSPTNTMSQTQTTQNMADGGSYYHLSMPLDMQQVGAEPLDPTLSFEDDPGDPLWLQI